MRARSPPTSPEMMSPPWHTSGNIIYEHVVRMLKSAFNYGDLDRPLLKRQDSRCPYPSGMNTAMIETGRELACMKERLGHGRFLKWIDAEFAMTPRTAQKYIGAAALHDKYENFSYLPVSALYDLASPTTPSHVRERCCNALGG